MMETCPICCNDDKNGEFCKIADDDMRNTHSISI